jgi:hypothetical protein
VFGYFYGFWVSKGSVKSSQGSPPIFLSLKFQVGYFPQISKLTIFCYQRNLAGEKTNCQKEVAEAVVKHVLANEAFHFFSLKTALQKVISTNFRF